MRIKANIVGFVFFGLLLTGHAYGGPVLCDGNLSANTAKATGKLLVAFGFYYSAIGFSEAGEQQKISTLDEMIKPKEAAKESEKLFAMFVKTGLPLELKKLDYRVRKMNYSGYYKKLFESGYFIPEAVWTEISNRTQKDGLIGLMNV